MEASIFMLLCNTSFLRFWWVSGHFSKKNCVMFCFCKMLKYNTAYLCPPPPQHIYHSLLLMKNCGTIWPNIYCSSVQYLMQQFPIINDVTNPSVFNIHYVTMCHQDLYSFHIFETSFILGFVITLLLLCFQFDR